MANSFKVAAMFGAMVVSLFVSFGTAEAQEKGVATGTETAQVAENVEAQAMAVTVETLIAKWAMEKALRKSEEIEVMREPVETTVTSGILQATYYFRYTGGDSEAEYEDPDNWEYLPGGLPGTDNCGFPKQMVCVLNTQDIAVGSVAALIDFLRNDIPSAETYCRDSNRKSYEKPL